MSWFLQVRKSQKKNCQKDQKRVKKKKVKWNEKVKKKEK
jgi:hypothetical protein